MNNGWLPSSHENRAIHYSIEYYNQYFGTNYSEPHSDQSSLELMYKLIMPNTKPNMAHPWRRFCLDQKQKQIIHIDTESFIYQYDYTALDERLKNGVYKANNFLDDERHTFIIRGIVDAQGYQNISDVLSSLEKMGMLERSSIQHLNCMLTADVVVSFDGKISKIEKKCHDIVEDPTITRKLMKRTHYHFDFTSHEKYLPQHLRQHEAVKHQPTFFNKTLPKASSSVNSKTPLLSSEKAEKNRTCGHCHLL